MKKSKCFLTTMILSVVVLTTAIGINASASSMSSHGISVSTGIIWHYGIGFCGANTNSNTPTWATSQLQTVISSGAVSRDTGIIYSATGWAQTPQLQDPTSSTTFKCYQHTYDIFLIDTHY